MNGPVAEFSHVTKIYRSRRGWSGRLRALDNLSLRVLPGEVTGLLGPNRAGKTTFVKLLLTLCQPSEGQVARLGQPAGDRRTLARVGYAHELPCFPGHLTPIDLLRFLGTLSEMPPALLDHRIRELLKKFELDDCGHEPLRKFSKGMVQRLVLAQALLNEPELLILDEPFEGLDLTGRYLLGQILREHAESGRAAILVTHAIDAALVLCDRVAVLARGALVFHGLPSQLGSAERLPPGWGSALARHTPELALR